MSHPKPEEWVPYLYKEAKPEVRHQLRQHLQTCPDCRAEVAAWKHTLGRLDSWQAPKPLRLRITPLPALKWPLAATAVLVLGLGFILGRLTSNAAAEAKLRTTLAMQLRQELRTDLGQLLREQVARATSATLAASSEQTKTLLAEYDRTVDARLDGERIQRLADCLFLKKDVDTIAVNVDAGLRDTEHRLAQLADYHQPSAFSNPPVNDSIPH